MIIKIIGLSVVGDIAIRQHLDEYKRMKFLERKQFNLLWKQELICDDPLTVCLGAKNKDLDRLIEPEDLINKVEKTLIKNGASRQDFSIEVNYD